MSVQIFVARTEPLSRDLDVRHFERPLGTRLKARVLACVHVRFLETHFIRDSALVLVFECACVVHTSLWWSAFEV